MQVSKQNHRNFEFNIVGADMEQPHHEGAIWDTYARSLAGREDLYCAVQLHPPGASSLIGQFGHKFHESSDPSVEAFSIFAVMHNGDTDCIGEISNGTWAMRFARAVATHYGWPFTDLTTM